MMAGGCAGIADRMTDIQAFQVMDILARARELEAQGRSIIHMEIGEPDFATPAPIIEAGIAALRAGRTHYTPALGLPALRAAIATYYGEHYGVNISPERVIVTPGSSGALLLALGVLLNPGEGVLMTDPGYPCNRHFVRLLEGRVSAIPVGTATDYQLTADLLARYWQAKTRVVMLASPSNPAGTIVSAEGLRAIAANTTARGGHLIMDEIYHGLVYGSRLPTALEYGDDIFVINSFSKFFNMTGWRIGWLIAPEHYVPAIDRLAQNIFLAASTPAQYAALQAFAPETRMILEQYRQAFRERRDYLLPALRALGFDIAAQPAGAFYLYADCKQFSTDSQIFARRLLDEAGVALTPGCDFGDHLAATHVRFAYTTALENLEAGVSRLEHFLRTV